MAVVIVSGLFVGLVYALLGVGLVVIYRGARTINFAYGETGMVASMVFADLWTVQHLPRLVALIAGVLLGVTLGALTEVWVARPLRHQPPVSTMVATLGVAALLLVFATRRWGLNPRYLPPLVGGTAFREFGINVQVQQLLILATTLALLGGLGWLYRYTSFGLRLRATALDRDAAAQVGVNTDLTATVTWALGGGIASLSAILIAPMVAFHVYFMTLLFVRGVAAALAGGLTSVGGAAITGIGLGVAEGIIGYTAPVSGGMELLIAAAVILLLLVRPAGLVRSAY